ncbi:MAG: RNA polymerase sigma factor RpoH [Magnetovibrionaceae bacterium]
MSGINLPAVPVEGGLSVYFRDVWKFPVLEADEEYMLAERWREHGDVDAAHALVTSHLRLVCKIAMKYRGYGLPVSDLVSEGNIGLMKAVRKFEPERGFRLSTYAMWWIRAAITEYILNSWSMVKVGTVAARKKLFFSLRKMKSKLNIMDQGELTDDQADRLAIALNSNRREIQDMNQRLSSKDLSLNAPMSDAEDSMEFQDSLEDDGPNPEALVGDREEFDKRMVLLREALAELPERERHILEQRRLAEDPQTLEDLGNHYGISRERVRQLEVRAFEKVKKLLSSRALQSRPETAEAPALQPA